MVNVKETKYVDYIKAKFPRLEIRKIDYNFIDGKYNDVVVINDEHVFKFARYDWSVAFLESEINVVSFVKDHVNMSLPCFEHLEKGVAKSSFIQGSPLFRNDLLLSDYKIQDYVAMQMAIFLKQLHSISVKSLKSRNIGEFPVEFTREAWLANYEEIKRKVFPYCPSHSKAYIEQLFKPLLTNEIFMDYRPALIHGDLSPCHVLYIKGKSRISGILGFGLAGIGDPAYDIGSVLDNLGEGFVRRMSRYYNVSALIDRARFYACASSINYAKEVADMISTRDFTHFRFNVKERDVMPPGSRWQNMT